MGLLEDCETLFGTDDLFKVLSLSRDADESKIKKAYYKMSLKVHPDKSTEDNLAENTQKFQVLSKIHKILSDKGTREVRQFHTIKLVCLFPIPTIRKTHPTLRIRLNCISNFNI